MNIRRLNPKIDQALYAQAFEWEKNYPRWLRDAEKACSVPLPEFLERAVTRADIGIFAPDFCGMVSIIPRGEGVFEGHIWARRGSAVSVLAEAVDRIRQSLVRDVGMRAGFVWIVKNNRPIKKVCILAGLTPDGAEVVDGESHGKPIVWQRLSCMTV